MAPPGPSDERSQGEHLLRLGRFDAMAQRQVQDVSVIPLESGDTHGVMLYITFSWQIN